MIVLHIHAFESEHGKGCYHQKKKKIDKKVRHEFFVAMGIRGSLDSKVLGPFFLFQILNFNITQISI